MQAGAVGAVGIELGGYNCNNCQVVYNIIRCNTSSLEHLTCLPYILTLHGQQESLARLNIPKSGELIPRSN